MKAKFTAVIEEARESLRIAVGLVLEDRREAPTPVEGSGEVVATAKAHNTPLFL